MSAEKDYALKVYRYSRCAAEDSETLEQAVDLLIDAAAMLISEGGSSFDQAQERLKESSATFCEAGDMVRAGQQRYS